MDKKQGWVQLTPETLAQLYSPYKTHSYSITYNKRVLIDEFLNSLHEKQLEFIDEAVDKSDLSQANELIKAIMEKK